MKDMIIIGAGPAGLSAAISAAARNVIPVVIGAKKSSGGLYKAEKINNYIGMPDVTGAEMMEAFLSHARNAGVEIKEGRALNILPAGEKFIINFEKDILEARAVILATGVEKRANVKGESEFLGKGVSYCATCDGMLYRSKTVVIEGEMSEGEEDANFLSDICAKTYYVYSYEGQPKVKENVTVIKGKVTEIFGGEFAEGAVVKSDGGDEKIQCDGVFLIKESTPVSALLSGIETEGGAIKVDRYMGTNIPGVYAAGDCTGSPFQVSKAVGEGLVAALTSVKHLKSGGS
ncbi:MAG: FAD-dependent oxidoreductase [Clostridiales bacterium]|jgi:thioredoxin reductase (NADPH)|nr:FAD-dependent oxidoreductase [Clostridiales bacterium]